MFFIAKSAFWLTIVFYCMSWPRGESPETVARAATRQYAAKAQAMVAEKASGICAKSPADCLSTVQAIALAREPEPARGLHRPKSAD
ncbi:MAG: hypothetical protein KGM42_13280 [Hyphomicrobiales bacterium]|nr:hypothetical protein [Hyphomicrobiales bacterium]